MPDRFAELETKFGECAWKLMHLADRIPQTTVEGGTVGAHLRALCRNLPAADASAEPAALARACWPVPQALHRLYLSTLGELVNLCESAEKARGIRPIRLVA
jgi:hypothetical protein